MEGYEQSPAHSWGSADDNSVVEENIAAMQISDRCAVLVAAAIIAFNVGYEIRDIKLCEFILYQHQGLKNQWYWLFTFLNSLRQYVFVPAVVATVPALVEFEGGDAKSVCFNTLAVLFLLVMDNEAYAYALPERTRSYVEENGRAAIFDGEARMLEVTKALHMGLMGLVIALVTIPVTSTMWVWRDDDGTFQGTHDTLVLLRAPTFIALVGGVVEAWMVGNLVHNNNADGRSPTADVEQHSDADNDKQHMERVPDSNGVNSGCRSKPVIGIASGFLPLVLFYCGPAMSLFGLRLGFNIVPVDLLVAISVAVHSHSDRCSDSPQVQALKDVAVKYLVGEYIWLGLTMSIQGYHS